MFFPDVGRRSIEHFRSNFPVLYKVCIKDAPDKQFSESIEFGLEGRGVQFLNSISKYPLARKEGTFGIFQLLGDSEGKIVLDVFGGDGYLTRMAKELGLNIKIITNDFSSFMVLRSIERGNPTTFQSAEELFLIKDSCLDAVVMAYGTHHLPPKKRLSAIQEAYRVLKKGGKFILHDFEDNSKMARFFRDVADKYSLTGHYHQHFNRKETEALFRKSGFVGVRSFSLVDDFVFQNLTKKGSLENCLEYFYLLYGLEKLGRIEAEETKNKLYTLIKKYLGIKVTSCNKKYECRVSRKAIIFFAEK